MAAFFVDFSIAVLSPFYRKLSQCIAKQIFSIAILSPFYRQISQHIAKRIVFYRQFIAFSCFAAIE